MGRWGKRLVLAAFGVTFLKPTAGTAFGGNFEAYLVCHDARTGGRFQIYGGKQTAAYQLNQALSAQLRSLGVGKVEPSGIGRFIGRFGWIYTSNMKSNFWFSLQKEDGRLVLRAFENTHTATTGVPAATIRFEAMNCQI